MKLIIRLMTVLLVPSVAFCAAAASSYSQKNVALALELVNKDEAARKIKFRELISGGMYDDEIAQIEKLLKIIKEAKKIYASPDQEAFAVGYLRNEGIKQNERDLIIKSFPKSKKSDTPKKAPTLDVVVKVNPLVEELAQKLKHLDPILNRMAILKDLTDKNVDKSLFPEIMVKINQLRARETSGSASTGGGSVDSPTDSVASKPKNPNFSDEFKAKNDKEIAQMLAGKNDEEIAQMLAREKEIQKDYDGNAVLDAEGKPILTGNLISKIAVIRILRDAGKNEEQVKNIWSRIEKIRAGETSGSASTGGGSVDSPTDSVASKPKKLNFLDELKLKAKSDLFVSEERKKDDLVGSVSKDFMNGVAKDYDELRDLSDEKFKKKVERLSVAERSYIEGFRLAIKS